jgi:hypothetical protein
LATGVKVGWQAVADEIKRFGAAHGNYSERNCAEAVLNAVNRGQQKKMEINFNRPAR